MDQLGFHGAAEPVTGSKYLLEAGGARVLVDCGLFQGLKELRMRNWDPLPLPGSITEAVLGRSSIEGERTAPPGMGSDPQPQTAA